MHQSRKKRRDQDAWPLPSFHAMFPAHAPSLEDASMTFKGLPPLETNDHANETKSHATTRPSPNEIVTAFESLDTDRDPAARSFLSEGQCRYRHGKCQEPRTVKKNGAWHTLCAYHRHLSNRNQRKFDRKKQRQQQNASEDVEKQGTASH